jgi:3-oxoacyl-[acyl-carrier-protein] synthase II
VLLHYDGPIAVEGISPVFGNVRRRVADVLAHLGAFWLSKAGNTRAARNNALAHIAAIATDDRRRPGEATAVATGQFDAMRHHLDPSHTAVISGASGASAATVEEAAFLRDVRLPVRATATAFGHSLEPSFPANLAIAAISLARRRLFQPLEAAELEAPMTAELRQLRVTSWGHWRGESLAVVEAA